MGKLKNLRIGSDDIAAQSKNLDVLKAVEAMLELIADLGTVAAYLSQAEMVLLPEHPWVKQAQEVRKQLLDDPRFALHDAFCEPATHRRWATGVLERAQVFGVAG